MGLLSRVSVAAALIGMAATLSGCGGTNKIAPACPEVRVPVETGTLTRFQPGEGKDITDIVLEASYESITGECDVSDEDVQMKFLVQLVANKGPSAKAEAIPVDLYIAVFTADRSQRLSQREIPVTLTFEGNQPRTTYSEWFTVDIPKTEKQTGEDFVVFTGFQLSHAEVEYNRKNK